MSQEDLIAWILDTIAEGGYSVRELYDYIKRGVDDKNNVESALVFLFNRLFIEVFVAKDKQYCTLDLNKSLDALSRFIISVGCNKINFAHHYFKITDEGLNFLKSLQELRKK